MSPCRWYRWGPESCLLLSGIVYRKEAEQTISWHNSNDRGPSTRTRPGNSSRSPYMPARPRARPRNCCRKPRPTNSVWRSRPSVPERSLQQLGLRPQSARRERRTRPAAPPRPFDAAARGVVGPTGRATRPSSLNPSGQVRGVTCRGGDDRPGPRDRSTKEPEPAAAADRSPAVRRHGPPSARVSLCDGGPMLFAAMRRAGSLNQLAWIAPLPASPERGPPLRSPKQQVQPAAKPRAAGN